MSDTNDTSLSIFNADISEKQYEAIEVLISGKTPQNHIRKRPARGGGQVDYVSTYFMTRMMNLLTGFRWVSECLEERFRPNQETPIEVMVKMKVTYWDKSGRAYSHTAWGTKDVAYLRGKEKVMIALGDDLKAAYSDGIKKCLSYFGIADDVYGGKEAETYIEEAEGEGDDSRTGGNGKVITDQQKVTNLLSQHGKSWRDAFTTLKVKDASEILDYAAALEILKQHIGEQQ